MIVYRRFETTGEISFRKLVEIAKFFDLAGDIKNLFTKREYSSIEEALNENPSIDDIVEIPKQISIPEKLAKNIYCEIKVILSENNK